MEGIELGNIGFPELVIVLAIALVVFGPKKLPELGRAIGQGLREFRKASREITEEIEAAARDADEGDQKSTPPARREPADR